MGQAFEWPADAGDDEIINAVVHRLGADSGTLHLLGADGLLHLQAATAGFPESVMTVIRAIPVGKGMAGLAAQRRQPVDTCNIQTDTSGDVRPGARATALSGAVVVPVFRGDAVVGTLGVGNRGERSFTPAEVDDLLAIGRRLAERYPQAAPM